MLILTRCLHQSCLIDGDIEVVVLAIEGNRVRLGFKAPEDVCVLRAELARARRTRSSKARRSRSRSGE